MSNLAIAKRREYLLTNLLFTYARYSQIRATLRSAYADADFSRVSRIILTLQRLRNHIVLLKRAVKSEFPHLYQLTKIYETTIVF